MHAGCVSIAAASTGVVMTGWAASAMNIWAVSTMVAATRPQRDVEWPSLLLLIALAVVVLVSWRQEQPQPLEH
jgi:hypothetical protein